MHFSQDQDQGPPQSKDVRLKYSTNTKNTEEAKAQAKILAERHFDHIPKDLRVAKRKWLFRKKSPARCAFEEHKEHSILIRNIGTVAPEVQEDGNTLQWLTSISDDDSQLLMNQMLRLPGSSFQVRRSDPGGNEIGIQTQISYAEWRVTVGETPSDSWGRIMTSKKAIHNR